MICHRGIKKSVSHYYLYNMYIIVLFFIALLALLFNIGRKSV
jgi:hypothetical protein